jgi:hypothetical protein
VAAAIGTDEGTIALINEGQEGRDMAWASEYKKENKVPDIDSYGVVMPLAKQMADFENKFHAPGTRKLANGKYHGMCIAPNHEFSNGGKITSRTFTAAAMVNLSVDNGKVFFTA